MPKLSASALKVRIDQLQKQLAAAEANKAPAIKKVRALMKKLGGVAERPHHRHSRISPARARCSRQLQRRENPQSARPGRHQIS